MAKSPAKPGYSLTSDWKRKHEHVRNWGVGEFNWEVLERCSIISVKDNRGQSDKRRNPDGIQVPRWDPLRLRMSRKRNLWGGNRAHFSFGISHAKGISSWKFNFSMVS